MQPNKKKLSKKPIDYREMYQKKKCVVKQVIYCTRFTASQYHYKPCAPDGQLHQFPGIKNIVPLIKRQVIVQRRSHQLQLALLHCVLTTTFIVHEISVISCTEKTCD